MKKRILAGLALLLVPLAPLHEAAPARAPVQQQMAPMSPAQRLERARLFGKPIDSALAAMVRQPAFLARIDTAERALPRYLPSLARFVDENLASLDTLTRGLGEQYGAIQLDNGSVRLVKQPDRMPELLRYVAEMKSGDFAHVEALADLGGAYRLRPRLNDFLLQMAAYPAYHQRKHGPQPAPSTGSYTLFLSTPGGKVRASLSPDVIDSLGRSTDSMFATIYDSVRTRAPAYSINDWDSPSTVVRFHTHPRDAMNHLPSPEDLVGSLFNGPNVLFIQSGGVFYAYAISRGSITVFAERRLRK